MPHRAHERSSALGGAVCLGAALAAALFLYGISIESYWALALPLGALVLFVLGLVFWIGWTILTVRAEAEGAPLDATSQPSAPTTPAAEGGPEPPSDAGS
jgi:hypothetical protein